MYFRVLCGSLLLCILIEWIFIETEMLNWMQNAPAQTRAGSSDPARNFPYYLGLAYVHMEGYLIAAAYTLLVFLVRLLESVHPHAPKYIAVFVI